MRAVTSASIARQSLNCRLWGGDLKTAPAQASK
jgi:hypothetical protein